MNKREIIVTNEQEEEMLGFARPRLVPCFALADVLDASQLRAVEPFMRETFSEMAKDLLDNQNSDDWIDGSSARCALMHAAERIGECIIFDEWRLVERRLYALALARGCTPVMHEGRRS